jgi:hypothetical protein
MAIGEAPKKSPGVSGREWRGLELVFDGIVAGWDIEGQEKMAKIWRNLVRGREWLELALGLIQGGMGRPD